MSLTGTIGYIASALSFSLAGVKEVLIIKRKIPRLFIDCMCVVSDAGFNPESMFVDCFISNNSTDKITIKWKNGTPEEASP